MKALAVSPLSMRMALLASLLVVVAAEAANHALGRPLICPCGFVKLWHGGRGDSQMSQHIADWLTYAHVLQGAALYWLLSLVARGHLSLAARLLLAVVLAAGWDVLAHSRLLGSWSAALAPVRGPLPESIVNSAADMLATVSGFYLAARLPGWITVGLILLVEGGLVLLTGHSLLLDLAMLAYPLEAVRAWQADF